MWLIAQLKFRRASSASNPPYRREEISSLADVLDRLDGKAGQSSLEAVALKARRSMAAQVSESGGEGGL